MVLTHGNGPQVGLLALQAAALEDVEPYPLDVLGAQTEGMIGYMIEQELGNLLPYEQPLASILTMVKVDPNDPALQAGAIAVARRRFSGWNIVGGTAIFDSLETARTSTMHHELGHMVGLGHSDSRADIMYPYERLRVESFTPRERLGVRLIMQRPAGNKRPDNDRDVPSPATLMTEWTLMNVCYR